LCPITLTFRSENWIWSFRHCLFLKQYKVEDQAKIYTQTIQNGVTKKCSIYQKYKKTKKNAIDINITQMMVGKQWVRR